VPYSNEGIKVAITRHLNGDMHERGNETATVPARRLVITPPRERAWNQRIAGKEDPVELRITLRAQRRACATDSGEQTKRP